MFLLYFSFIIFGTSIVSLPEPIEDFIFSGRLFYSLAPLCDGPIGTDFPILVLFLSSALYTVYIFIRYGKLERSHCRNQQYRYSSRRCQRHQGNKYHCSNQPHEATNYYRNLLILFSS